MKRAARSRRCTSISPRKSNRSTPGPEAETRGIQPEHVDGRVGQERVANEPEPRRCVGLQEPVSHDDIRPGELHPACHALADGRSDVDHEFQVQLRDATAGLAGAGRCLGHAQQSGPKGRGRRVDGIEQRRAGQLVEWRHHEGGVAFELLQPERRSQLADDGLDQIGRHGRRSLRLAGREVGGVAGQVGQQHADRLRRWSLNSHVGNAA